MLDTLRRRLTKEPDAVRRRVELVRQDMRRLQLDRLFRMVCLPFNTLLMLAQPHDRYEALAGVREHLAPSGAFAFDVFTPDPARLTSASEWEIDLEHEANDPEAGRVRVRRDILRHVDQGRQLMRSRFRYRITRVGAAGEVAGDGELASWEEEMEIAYIFPRELELLLERQGFRMWTRHGGPDGRAYDPTAEDVQPQYVVARLQP
jgi:hypothetical protein